MDQVQYQHWLHALENKDKQPAYLKIVDLISADIENGKLQVRDRLPPLRELANFLKLDYTTAARAYREAKSRGLIDSQRGMGSFIRGKTKTISAGKNNNFDMTMNLPPEPQSWAFTEKVTSSAREAIANQELYSLLRYQDFGGSMEDKEAAKELLSPLIPNPNINQVLVCPGIHSVLVALLSQLTSEGGTVCVENLTYPGIKAISAQLGAKLTAIDCDSSGPLIKPLEALCKTQDIAAIYLNPTIQNPTTRTISKARREAIADIALRYSIPIIEDDAYGLLPEKPVSPIFTLAPELTYYITGLAKCFGAGLRIAYLYAPSKLLAQRTASTLRALSVMTSPISAALATHWIRDGSINEMIRLIREESRTRQAIAANYLSPYKVDAHSDGFHLWLTLPNTFDFNPSVIAAHLRSQQVSVVSSAAFCTNNNPPHAVRICLGGAISHTECEEAMQIVSDTLEHPSHLSSTVI